MTQRRNGQGGQPPLPATFVAANAPVVNRANAALNSATSFAFMTFALSESLSDHPAASVLLVSLAHELKVKRLDLEVEFKVQY